MFSNITRGGQLLSHHIVMLAQVIRRGFKFGLMFCVMVFGLYVYYSVPTQTWREAWVWKKASFYYDPTKDQRQVKITATRADGKVFHIPVAIAYKHPKIRQSYLDVWSTIYSGMWAGLIGIFILFGGTVIVYYLYGRKQKETEHIRGTELVAGKELRKFVINRIGQFEAAKCIKLTADRIPLTRDAETWNMLIAGSTGSGKTKKLESIAYQVRQRGQKGLSYERKGSTIPFLYREKKDWILNPGDLRMPNWNLFDECRDPEDFDSIAETLMPHHISTSDPFWINSARTIFSAACREMQAKGTTDTRELLRQIFNDASDEDKLSELLKGTEAESLVSKDIKQTALGIKATLSTYCKSLLYLPQFDKNKRNFCIRDWVESNDDSWLFISIVRSRKRAAYRPLISIWADIALQAILDRDLGIDYGNRIWSFFDELPSLQRLASIETLMAEGREHGSGFIATVQDINQWKTTYGTEERTLTSLFNTILFLRTKHPDSAEIMSRWLGKREYFESREGLSYGANTIRDGVNIGKDKRDERIVSPTQIQKLRKLEGFLSMAEDEPVAKVKIEPKKYKKIAERIVQRKITYKDIDLKEVGGYVGELPSFVTGVKVEQIDDNIIEDIEDDEVVQDDSSNEETKDMPKEKKPRKTRKDKGIKKKKDDNTTEDSQTTVSELSDASNNEEKKPINIKTVIGYVASPIAKKNDAKQTIVVTVNLAQNNSSTQDGFVTQTTIWHKLIFFDKLAESALKQIKKGCRVEAHGEYRKNVDVDEDTGEENVKHEIIVKKFKILSNAREKEKPKEHDLKTAKIYQESKDLKRNEYSYEMDSKSISR